MASSEDIADLAAVIMSEASVSNSTERTCVGFAVVNRMLRTSAIGGSTSGSRGDRGVNVRSVWSGFAHHQVPAPDIVALAKQILDSIIQDPSDGCTHFYSPRSMPKEGESSEGFDVAGGLEQSGTLSKKNFRPSWANTLQEVTIPGVRVEFYRFFKP
jgi:hypothetical protein